jgi:hypothetical protein
MIKNRAKTGRDGIASIKPFNINQLQLEKHR